MHRTLELAAKRSRSLRVMPAARYIGLTHTASHMESQMRPYMTPHKIPNTAPDMTDK